MNPNLEVNTTNLGRPRPLSQASMATYATRAETISTTFEKLALEEPPSGTKGVKEALEDLSLAFQAVLSTTKATDADQLHGLSLMQYAVQKRLTREWVLNLRDRDAICMLDVLQNWLDSESAHPIRQRVILLLVKLAATSEQIPSTLFLRNVDLGGVRDPEFMGGFADVFRARYRGQEVAVKRLRVSSNFEKALLYRKFCREALIWRQLRHKHVLPFLGVDRDNFAVTKHLCMVALWMNNGTVRDFVRTKSYVPKLHCNRLLLESASGLFYLHSQNVIHGDVNDVNILVDADYHAQLADFGLTLVGESSVAGMTSSESGAGTLRWKAPEFHNEDSRRSFAGDVWAFACLCLALYTQDRPYRGVSDNTAMRYIMTGRHPKRPSAEQCHGFSLSDNIWQLMMQCWIFEPPARPPMSEILENLQGLMSADISADPPLVTSTAIIVSQPSARPANLEEPLAFYLNAGNSAEVSTAATLHDTPPPPYQVPMQVDSSSYSQDELVALGMTQKILLSARKPKLEASEPIDPELVSRGMTRSVSNAARRNGKTRAPTKYNPPSPFALRPVQSQPKEKRTLFGIGTFWGRRRDESSTDMYRTIEHLVANRLSDWNLVQYVCDTVSHSDVSGRLVVRALQDEFKYGGEPDQLFAGKLWAILLKSCSHRFLDWCGSADFLSAVQELLTSPNTTLVIHERVYTVLAGAVDLSLKRRQNWQPLDTSDPLQALWTKVKYSHHPTSGIPFDFSDEMFEKTIPSRKNIENNEQKHEPVLLMREHALSSDDDYNHHEIRTLLEECKIGTENALALEEALTVLPKFELNGTNVKLQERILQCRSLEKSISSEMTLLNNRRLDLHSQQARDGSSTIYYDGDIVSNEQLANEVNDTVRLLQDVLRKIDTQAIPTSGVQPFTPPASHSQDVSFDTNSRPIGSSSFTPPQSPLPDSIASPVSDLPKVTIQTYPTTTAQSTMPYAPFDASLNKDLWYPPGYQMIETASGENILRFKYSDIFWNFAYTKSNSLDQGERIKELLGEIPQFEYPEDLNIAVRFAALLSECLMAEAVQKGIEYSHPNVKMILNFCWRAFHSIPGRISMVSARQAKVLFSAQNILRSMLEQVHASIDRFDAEDEANGNVSPHIKELLLRCSNEMGSPSPRYVSALSGYCSQGRACSHELFSMLKIWSQLRLVPLRVAALVQTCQDYQECIHSQLPFVAQEVAFIKRFEVTGDAQRYKSNLIQLLDDMVSTNNTLLDVIMLYDDYERALPLS